MYHCDTPKIYKGFKDDRLRHSLTDLKSLGTLGVPNSKFTQQRGPRELSTLRTLLLLVASLTASEVAWAKAQVRQYSLLQLRANYKLHNKIDITYTFAGSSLNYVGRSFISLNAQVNAHHVIFIILDKLMLKFTKLSSTRNDSFT